MVMSPREARYSKGVSAKHMCLALGISYKSFARKERGETQWKANEEARFLKELNLPKTKVDFTLHSTSKKIGQKENT